MPPMSLKGGVQFVLGKLFPAKMLNVGDLAPDFTALDHRGETVRLRDLRGKRVVLWFYPKADTPG